MCFHFLHAAHVIMVAKNFDAHKHRRFCGHRASNEEVEEIKALSLSFRL